MRPVKSGTSLRRYEMKTRDTRARLSPDPPRGPNDPACRQSPPKEGRSTMRSLSCRFICSVIALTMLCLAAAASPLRAQPLHERIDQLIATGTPDFAQQAAPPA